MRVLGMISGTSHDGVDVAIVDLEVQGDRLAARLQYGDSTPYPPQLRDELVAALPPHPVTAQALCALDTRVGQYFGEVAAAAIAHAGPVEAICSHGQTLYHWVDGDRCLGTLQVGQPAWIAERTGVPVIADVRARDITVGGHGAPLVPLLDDLLLAGLAVTGSVASLNLGGIANVTVLGRDAPLAYDIGPANALIDAVVQDRGLDPAGYDTGGRLAALGSVQHDLLAQLRTEPYYRRRPPRSTGKELFALPHVAEHLQRLGHPVGDADLIATLTRLTAETVAAELRQYDLRTVVAAGGGVENPVLMRWLADQLPGVQIETTQAYGVPPGIKEAVAFALIGWYTLHGLPGAVPSATGARDTRVLGSITPGRVPLTLPAPVPRPRSLQVLA